MQIIVGNFLSMGFNKRKSISNNLILFNREGSAVFVKKFTCNRFLGYFRFFSDFFNF